MSTSLSGGSAVLSRYRVPAGHFDELLAPDGDLRAEWARFAGAADLGPEALAHAARRVAQQIHENGVTYNVYVESSGSARPWSLDVLPALIPAGEWNVIERGLAQRARLLNAMAADLYGAQRLLAERVVPAGLVINHAGFQRACHGIRPPGGVHLHLAAFDLARAADGQWHVVSTRVQAPSGLGYALENRAVISRIFPEAARTLGLRPLTPFIDRLQEVLVATAPSGDETPSAVLLTPGRYNETYFEHVFLARELGIPLVEGSDLTVRSDRVYLKTVSGLRPVHAIWRRVDDDYSDPLELRADSTLGVPGLVQAWRAGRVLIANAFGLSVFESPALSAFLPDACQRLLGESLEVPSIPTWWRGENADGAPAPVDNIVIHPARAPGAMAPVFLAGLTAARQDAWRDRLSDASDVYAVQPFVPMSHAPVWHDGGLEDRALSVRVFLLADGRGGYDVMPGGLCRVAGDRRPLVSAQGGGSSKDTWVLGAAPSEVLAGADYLARPIVPSDGERTTSSRAAEMLFWLGRYAERSENSARLLRATLARLAGSREWPPRFQSLLVRTCLGQALLVPADLAGDAGVDRDERGSIERALLDGLRNVEARRSLRYNVDATVRAAEAVRDRLSSDNWRVLSRLTEQVTVADESAIDLNDALQILDDVILSLVAAGGLEMAHMTRDHGWRFLSIGRHLERLAFVAGTLDAAEAEHAISEPAVLDWLLELSDSIITYRARHMRRPEWKGVVDLLVFDERNPRSAAFQIGKLAKHVRMLPGTGPVEILEEVSGMLRDGRSATGSQGRLFEPDAGRASLFPACEQLALALSDALTLQYFSHVYERARAVVTR